jgi:hypothetical protein
MKAPPFRFTVTCVESDGESIQSMHDAARDITRATFCRLVNREDRLTLERRLQYDTGRERGGLRMANDWHVAYFRSTYRGAPCVGFDHSRIDHIFTEAGR